MRIRINARGHACSDDDGESIDKQSNFIMISKMESTIERTNLNLLHSWQNSTNFICWGYLEFIFRSPGGRTSLHVLITCVFTAFFRPHNRCCDAIGVSSNLTHESPSSHNNNMTRAMRELEISPNDLRQNFAED